MSVIEATDKYTAANYARFPVAFVRGEGVRLFDESGKRYLDMFSGLAVSALGHGHPGLAKAIADQAATLIHTSNLYYHAPGAELAERLVQSTFADRVFFCNSGTEANEAAIKMSRRARPSRTGIVTAYGSFHGRTLGSLAATGQPDLQEGFGPMPGGFVHVEYDDVEGVRATVDETTAAVMVEPIIGEGGIIVPAPDYLKKLRKICDEAGALLILDEVQTGVGRTGFLYAYQDAGIEPDIVTSAKALAGGMPIGAVLAKEETAAAFVPGTHGSTFGANPVACRAALAVLDALENEGVLDNVRSTGAHLAGRLQKLASTSDKVRSVRGKGLMWGIVLDRPARPLVETALERGLVINATAGDVVRLLPPLVISNAEIDEGIDLIETLLEENAE
jgi:predicted acetylornithine/succinylornithine family transaminase